MVQIAFQAQSEDFFFFLVDNKIQYKTISVK